MSFPFLSLPLELREAVYSLYFKPADRLVRNESLESQGYYGGVYDFDFNLYKVNRQVYEESKRVWKRENVFVKIATPWPSAGMYRVYIMAEDGNEVLVNHISSEGLVPIVCTSTRADVFTAHHALVQITAPFHQAVPEHTVVVLLDDLHLFTQTWYYSALSYPMLNDRLSTAFVLGDPDATPGDTTPAGSKLSIALQKRLLLPFEAVKGLYHTEISNYAPDVAQELKRRMAIPIPSLQHCCESAHNLMVQGNVLLPSNPQESLESYIKAFRAIHILIHNRTRRVLADVFFHEGIESGRFAGQTGMTVRVVLRLKLVARVILAYLKLGKWDDAAFWGMRSIRIMRESMDTDFEDFLSEFIGGEDVALIYVRTGVAFWSMESEMKQYDGEELASSEKLFQTAVRYLKDGRKGEVRRELEGFGVPRSVLVCFKDEVVDDKSTMGVDGSAYGDSDAGV
ncbi:hypothetical protein EK21DRAFT_67513 [Setomelanomma holmii]|uniref:Uncharacterized protein n=1 Tax=Setomelanomma holmii TaxID=210430 RepID=A0A9P4LLS0_9PLEO|nr:hypothetical protein EK21DRAFT_67513 [Setomelanomma holmii]